MPSAPIPDDVATVTHVTLTANLDKAYLPILLARR